jgi:hypothetical protein
MGNGFTPMTTESEIKRLESILELSAIIYGLENINPLIIDLLNQISLDIEWLCERLSSAWSTVHAYQEEIKHLYNEGI